MKAILKVENFGPIDKASLDLRNVNVLIGPQASGKSTLAKLYTICKSPVMYHELEGGEFSALFYKFKELNEDVEKISYVTLDKFKSSLEHFSILSFYSSKTIIEFDSPTHKLTINRGKINFVDKINIQNILEFYKKEDIENIKKGFDSLRRKSDVFNFKFIFTLYFLKQLKKRPKNNGNNWFDGFYDFHQSVVRNGYSISIDEARRLIQSVRQYKSDVFNNKALYIPAERTIINLLKQASFTLQKAKVPLPSHLLDYATIYENSTDKVKKLDLSFLKEGITFKNVSGIDKIYYSPRKSIKLSESASGFQSVVPMILPIQNEKSKSALKEHYSFVIEEPETNLFPKAQYDLLKFLEKDRSDDFEKIDKGIIHTYTTHSPFVLSSLNNMLYAFKKGHKAPEGVKIEINKILNQKNWIDPKYFSAYQIINGKAISIMDRKTGLIKENVIDEVSEDIVEDFRKIGIASLKGNG